MVNVPVELSPEKKDQLNDLLYQLELCESLNELKSVTNKMSDVGDLPDKDRHHATEIYQKNHHRIKLAIEAEQIPV